MSADRARVTHYPPRKYREIISQQGRVLLEADSNEGQRTFTEEGRHEALDFVGSCGTPDTGYVVTPADTDFTIAPGTMYVGGLRVTLETLQKYSQQPDWLDTGEAAPWGEGLWQTPAALAGKNFEAALLLREQEITAVEDPALRDVALGGPDSAARTRLLQRVVATATTATNCAAAAGDAINFWSGHGLIYNPATAELTSRALLQVTPVTDAPPPSPCDPPSASGYLGADNQLIRVQVTAFDSAKNTGALLWGYYNASTLYRCTVQTASTLKLASRPVSAEYQPRSGQVVQVLQRAADLGEGAYAAALTGHFTKLTAAYAPDTQIVTLPNPIPEPPYADSSNVYLRLWEDQVDFTLGTAAVLVGTGLQVTLTESSGGPLHVGDYWCMAARPTTPNTVYPERLVAAPQPPDGPRMWACPLAVMQGGPPFTLLDDCRLPFDNLPELTARKSGDCCCVKVAASQASELQTIIDKAASSAGAQFSIQFEAGTYSLRKPIIITGKHKGLTLEACTGGKVILSAEKPQNPDFFFGMILAMEGADLTLRGLDFETPFTPAQDFLQTGKNLPKLSWIPKVLSFGIRAVYCDSLRLEDCSFQLPESEQLYGAAVLIQGDNGIFEALRCRFFGPPTATNSIYAGVLAAPFVLSAKEGSPRPTTLNLARIDECLFGFMLLGVALVGGMRYVWASGSCVRGNSCGFLLVVVSRDFNQLSKLSSLVAPTSVTVKGKAKATDQLNSTPDIDQVFQIANVLGLASLASEVKEIPREKEVTLGDQAANAKLPPIALPGVQSAPSLCLTLQGNQFDCRPLAGAIESNSAILISNGGIDSDSCFANIAANTVWNRSSTASTLVVKRISAVNVTGNVFVNDVPSGARPALSIEPGATVLNSKEIPLNMMTVTGNTILGATNLGSLPREEWKDAPSGLSTWEFFNTITS